jgi:DNA-binding Lrp family transcriptional regulator
MPVSAYILIQTEVGRTNVARHIADIDGIASADAVSGPYDVIVRVEARTLDDLGRMVHGQVQVIEGIRSTVTCPVVHL